ncbi:MAG: PepSY-associated TM helix domain-containing protein [Siphonobacter sp.]
MKAFLQNLAKHQKRWFAKWHLYLGIGAGLIVSIIGLTGSILVFQDEIDEALNPDLFVVLRQQRKLPFDEIIPILQHKYPKLKVNYLYNEFDTRTYVLYDPDTKDQTFINPYTAEITGKRLHTSSFIGFVTELHRTLLIPVIGQYIVGLSALILLILTISGLRLWIPKKWKHFKANLTVNFKANFKRQNYDWHNVLGFYSAPVVSLLSLTGFCITFSALVIPMLFILSFQPPKNIAQLLGPKSAYHTGAQPLPLKRIMDVAHQTFPNASVRGFRLPADSLGTFSLDLVSEGTSKTGQRDLLLIDQYTGKVMLNSETQLPNIGKAYLSWLTPIHFGTFGGRATQILALLGSLMPSILFVTGFIIWFPRWKKGKSRPQSIRRKQKLAEEN